MNIKECEFKVFRKFQICQYLSYNEFFDNLQRNNLKHNNIKLDCQYNFKKNYLKTDQIKY